jgi:2'-5' RNA ligase
VRLGLAPEGRRFTPHVTLAHLVGGADPVRLVAFQAAHAAFAPPPEPVEAFTLFSSWALGDGRHYVPEARFPLTPR